MIHTPKRKDALILICLFTLMNSLIKCRVLLYTLNWHKHNIRNFVICSVPHLLEWCQAEIGGKWSKTAQIQRQHKYRDLNVLQKDDEVHNVSIGPFSFKIQSSILIKYWNYSCFPQLKVEAIYSPFDSVCRILKNLAYKNRQELVILHSKYILWLCSHK